MISLGAKIEAILFWKAAPMSVDRLSEILNVEPEQVRTTLSEMEPAMTGRGLVLLKKDNEVLLATSPEVSELIEKLTKDELNRELGKAGLETLSIIVYFGPISRSEIDYIRGVNSTFALRSLMMRGLVERVQQKDDQRVFQYKPTFELLTYLGVKSIEELPEYEKMKQELSEFKQAQASAEKNENES